MTSVDRVDFLECLGDELGYDGGDTDGGDRRSKEGFIFGAKGGRLPGSSVGVGLVLAIDMVLRFCSEYERRKYGFSLVRLRSGSGHSAMGLEMLPFGLTREAGREKFRDCGRSDEAALDIRRGRLSDRSTPLIGRLIGRGVVVRGRGGGVIACRSRSTENALTADMVVEMDAPVILFFLTKMIMTAIITHCTKDTTEREGKGGDRQKGRILTPLPFTGLYTLL